MTDVKSNDNAYPLPILCVHYKNLNDIKIYEIMLWTFE